MRNYHLSKSIEPIETTSSTNSNPFSVVRNSTPHRALHSWKLDTINDNLSGSRERPSLIEKQNTPFTSSYRDSSNEKWKSMLLPTFIDIKDQQRQAITEFTPIKDTLYKNIQNNLLTESQSSNKIFTNSLVNSTNKFRVKPPIY